ncbi:hypothetical protein D3C77_397010 [compost metagenome]
MRQLKYVSVTFVLSKEAKPDDLCAILTQTASTTLLEADAQAARALYPKADDADKKSLDDFKIVQHNPRENQQIALSSAIAEDGLGYAPGTWVYELMFHDGRYLPFEGTGAISWYTLEIKEGSALYNNPELIEDIVFNMVYTAKAGDSGFTSDVRKMVADFK